jgi:hypothetical protein
MLAGRAPRSRQSKQPHRKNERKDLKSIFECLGVTDCEVYSIGPR